ncbi:MAG: DUF3943 domain-containing protein [Prevotellaceae bacterium]|jgi:hypothetical protein|nr:DUF3943 domain-containing protein [Prevotellaceae bacterium]
MRKLIIIVILFAFSTPIFAQFSIMQDTTVTYVLPDSVDMQDEPATHIFTDGVNNQHYKPKKSFGPLIAASEVIVLNAGVHIFDRFILKTDWAQVKFSDIGNNFKKGFVWDNDYLSTNMFWHPYHGGLYFNSARANGLNFWQSVPYSFAGSFIWEFFGETNYPSINDLLATSIGGMAIGEMTHRVSHLVLNDSKHGIERVGREILAGIISPMDMLNRILSGKAWHHSPFDETQNVEKPNFVINLAVQNRFMTDLDNNRNNSNVALGFTAIYGNPFADQKRLPYDYFTANIDFNIIGKQPLISNGSIIGLLWGNNWEKKNYNFLAGVFQHFDYYNSNPLIENGKLPYEYAEAASFGGGFLAKKQKNENKPPIFTGSFYANFILLGASESDYYSVYERNYNFGMGFSVKVNAAVNFAKRFSAFFNAKTYQIFTLNKAVDEDYYSIYDEYNSQGNNGYAQLHLLGVGIGCKIFKWLNVNVEQRFFIRHSHYKYFDDVSANSMENRVRIVFSLFNNDEK